MFEHYNVLQKSILNPSLELEDLRSFLLKTSFQN